MNNMMDFPASIDRFEPIGSIVPSVLKEVRRRVELRERLEAERGSAIADDEFLRIAERTGGVKL